MLKLAGVDGVLEHRTERFKFGVQCSGFRCGVEDLVFTFSHSGFPCAFPLAVYLFGDWFQWFD